MLILSLTRSYQSPDSLALTTLDGRSECSETSHACYSALRSKGMRMLGDAAPGPAREKSPEQ